MEQKYYLSIQKILEEIVQCESEKIQEAGKCVADTILSDGLVHVFGCGHSHMVAEEMFYRAGGLAPVNPLFEESAMLHAGARKSSNIERMSGYAVHVLNNYQINQEDTFIIASSSGINNFVIEMAEEAKKRCKTVIGITSDNYHSVPSRNKDGKRLMDVCSFFINNHVPVGDAAVEIEKGIQIAPVSSISDFFIANSIVIAACEELKKEKSMIPVFRSGNLPDGDAFNDFLIKKYRTRVKHL